MTTMAPHATATNEPLSVEQANILDRYLVHVPGYQLPNVRRRYEQMARELSMLGYQDGFVVGWNESCNYNRRYDSDA